MKKSFFAPAFFLLLISLLTVGALSCGGDDDDNDDHAEVDDDNSGNDDSDAADDDAADDDAADDDASPTPDDDADDDASPPPEYDPAQPGPYQVGNRTYVFVDESRYDPATDGPRTLVTEVWYPAVDEAADMDRDQLINFLAPWEEFVMDQLAAEGVPPDELDNFYQETGSAREAPIYSGAAPFPFLLYSHGNAGARFQNFTTCEYLASHGFVIIAPDHTGNALVAPLPEEPIVFDENLVFISYWERKADLSFLITKFTELAADDPDDFFTGRLDPSQVGAFGHSFGGTAVVETTRQDHRIKATLVMASFMFPWRPEDFDASLMWFIGQEDNTMGDANFLFRYDYRIARPPKFKLECRDCGHYSFTDACLIVPSLMGDGDGCGQGERRWTGEIFDFLEHDAAWAVMNPLITAFYGFNLRGEEHMAAYLMADHTTEMFDWIWRME